MQKTFSKIVNGFAVSIFLLHKPQKEIDAAEEKF